ncbi:hypothetical protein V8C86DRAFT_891945 [Haematococcus lacustris]
MCHDPAGRCTPRSQLLPLSQPPLPLWLLTHPLRPQSCTKYCMALVATQSLPLSTRPLPLPLLPLPLSCTRLDCTTSPATSRAWSTTTPCWASSHTPTPITAGHTHRTRQMWSRAAPPPRPPATPPQRAPLSWASWAASPCGTARHTLCTPPWRCPPPTSWRACPAPTISTGTSSWSMGRAWRALGWCSRRRRMSEQQCWAAIHAASQSKPSIGAPAAACSSLSVHSISCMCHLMLPTPSPGVFEVCTPCRAQSLLFAV